MEALIHYKNQRYDSALACNEKALEKDINADFLLLSGLALYQKGKHEQSRLYFEKANQLETGIGSFHLAKIAAKKDSLPKAIYHLENMMKSGYKLSKSKIMLEPVFQKYENKEEWREFWKKDWYTDFEIFLAELEYLISNEEYFDALDMIKQNKYKYEGEPKLYFTRAMIYKNLKSTKNAINELDQAIELDRRNDQLYFERALQQMKAGKEKKAIPDLDMAIRYNPYITEYYEKRAECHNIIGDTEEALEDMTFLAKLSPGDHRLYYETAMLYYQSEKYLEALPFLNKALNLKPRSKLYLVARGDTYFHTNTFNYALKDYASALDLDPGDSTIIVKKGLTAYAAGDLGLACEHWVKAKEMGNYEGSNLLWEYCEQ